MATLSVDIEVFINRTQQKIGTLGDTILANDIQGICIEYDISLLQELAAAVDMFQEDAYCCAVSENLSYKTIHYLTEKANLSILPIAFYDNSIILQNVLLPSGGYIEGPQGPDGEAATISIGTITLLPASDNPTVENSGNSSVAIFNFGIPAGTDGTNGTNGDTGWSPIYALVADGSREVLKLTGWTGGTGTEPATIDVYVGTTGYVVDIADGVDVKGATGTTGDAGDNGYNGWSPVIAIVSDGERRVMQVVSWTGGTGTAPTSGLYVSPSGLTAVLADATDIRGEQGIQGDPFIINADGVLSDRNLYDEEGAGFTFLATDTGDVYIKNSVIIGDWGPPVSFVGDKGWSPVLNSYEDGQRVLLRVSDWIGGQGTSPAVYGFIGTTGLVQDASDATDVRGPRGEFFIDVQGFLSDRGTYDSEDRPFTYYATDNGKIYLKNSDTPADWTDGFDWRGERGPDGEVGSQGENAFTDTTNSFTVPAVSSTVNVPVISTNWMSVGQVIYIATAGYYEVNTIVSETVVTVENLGYVGNAVPTTVITTAQLVSPGGIEGSVDTSAFWSITGNTLASRGVFGSSSGVFGFDIKVNNATKGGLENTFEWFFGTTAKFTDTSFSYKTLGSDNTTVGSWIKNSSDVTLLKVLNGGEVLIGRSDLVAGTQFNIKALGSSSAFYPIYVVNSSDAELFQILGDGKSVFGPTGGTTDFMNIGNSAANTYIRINADTGYDSGFRLYENGTFKGGFLSDSAGNTAQFYGQNAAACLSIDGDNNLGFTSTSFGGGEGVIAIGNIATDTSTSPVDGVIVKAKDAGASSELFVVDEAGFETQLS